MIDLVYAFMLFHACITQAVTSSSGLMIQRFKKVASGGKCDAHEGNIKLVSDNGVHTCGYGTPVSFEC